SPKHAEELRVFSWDISDPFDTPLGVGRETALFYQTGIIANLLANQFHASGLCERDSDRVWVFRAAGKIFVSVGGEHGDGIFFTAGPRSAFDHVKNTRVAAN